MLLFTPGATKTMGPNQQFFDLDTVQPDGSELAGQWLFTINSSQSYTFKVVGKICSLCGSFLHRCE